MRKIYGAAVLLFTLIMVSCFKDEGNYSFHPIDEIAIEGLGEIHQHYSYVKDTLKIEPTVSTAYKDMQYTWLLWREQEKGIDTIGENRNLAYEVNLKPGRYTVALKAASVENGYSSTETTQLEVTTEFGRGFYVLKENAEGNSDLDFYQDGKELGENLLEHSGIGALPGKPLCMGIAYAHGYINEQTNQTASCNAVFVTTDQKRVAFVNTEDLSLTQDNEKIVYGGLLQDETPYLAYTAQMYNYFLTDYGIYGELHGGQYSAASSAFAKEDGQTGGSRFIAPITYYAWGVYPIDAYLYWDIRKQCIDVFGGAYSTMVEPYNEGIYSTQGMECLMCGSVGSSRKCYFLLKDEADKKYLYECDAATLSTEARIEVPAASLLDKAVCYATNAKTADYLYFVTDNRLYAYHLGEREENTVPFALEGITAGEQIVHLSYQWVNVPADETLGTNFTHLVVGTQEGDVYRVRMYNILGGEPVNLVRTIRGNGRFKSVAYISPRYDADDFEMPSSSSLPN